MKRKSYAIVNLNIWREFEFELDDEKKLEVDEQEVLVRKIIEEKYGKLTEGDEIEISELDYSSNRTKKKFSSVNVYRMG